MSKGSKLLMALLLCLGATGFVTAQDYPTRPIRLVVPFAPGGGTDMLGRSIAQIIKSEPARWQKVVNASGARRLNRIIKEIPP